MEKTNSQIIQSAMNRYKTSKYSKLWQVYGSHSQAKENAMEYCKDLMRKLNGYDLRIIGHNCMTFSVGFRYSENGKDMFAYITRDYDRCTEWH